MGAVGAPDGRVGRAPALTGPSRAHFLPEGVRTRATGVPILQSHVHCSGVVDGAEIQNYRSDFQ